MALQPQELAGQLPLAAREHFDHGDRRVVVADPPGHAAEELEGPAMAFQERLRAFAGKGLDEDRARVGQRHHEQGHLRRLAGQLDGRFAEVDLGFARRMRQRQEDFLVRLLPRAHGVLDDRLAAVEAVLVAQPLEDPLGRVPLLLRRLTDRPPRICCNDRQER